MSKKTSREIALERRKAMSDSGKKAAAYSSTTKDRVRSSQDIQISGTQSSSNNQNITKPVTKHIPKTQASRKFSSTTLSSKELVIERRKAMSTHGKSAITSSDRTLSLVVEEKAAAFLPLSLIAFLLSSAISLLVFFDIIFKFKFFKKTFEKLSPKFFFGERY